MRRILGATIALVLAGIAMPVFAAEGDDAGAAERPVVVMETSKGSIVIELDPEAAPKTVANFLQYVDDGFYDGLVFHRVIEGFMIQGGGMTADLKRKETRDPIVNEAANGLKNDTGTIAMARTGVIDSATSQFFINTVDNGMLNHRDKSARGFGYAVFGKVIEGMDVVRAIEGVSTGARKGMQDVPVEPVVILSVKRR